MKRSPATLALRWSGRVLVAAILLFVLLPGVVRGDFGFQRSRDPAISAAVWSLRWFYRAFSYADFAKGFWNGLTVTVWASSIAVVVGSAFAFAIHRYKFALRDFLEGILLSPLIIPHYTVGLGILILASQTGIGRGFPLVIFAHVVMVLPFVMRSTSHLAGKSRHAPGAGRVQSRCHAAADPVHGDDPAADSGLAQRLAVRGDPVLQRIHGDFVRQQPGHADAAGRHV